jgi:predicted RNase H-like nuclease
MMQTERVIAGVDGCKRGWVAAVLRPGGEPEAAVHAGFAELLDSLPDDAVVVVDMPIGLPERVGLGGRGPERLVRPHLGPRQSSVFSVPSRAAVYAEDVAFTPLADWYAAHRRASIVARATSDPPRAISIQAFALFGKMREIDAQLIVRPALRARVAESHPEVAFWRLNGEKPMCRAKKISGRINEPGMKERRELLAHHGVPRAFLDRPAPSGAGADDFLDAVAMLMVARRFARGEAISFPDPPDRDARGIPIAIWT